ncbi:MAG: 30S ribosomal protein S4e [Nitrososphaerota archaeon]|nr:30S ribosomal protein S4e [Nitrososphaerota archaeon]MDG6939507.1 30S ribosomal protein S4e [Nitrososphaerota archaeon]
MGRKAGSNRLKREAAPRFYAFPRKKYTFVTRQEPGPHAASLSYDPITLLRDVLRITRTKKEAASLLREGKMLVDGKARRNRGFPLGLMDVVELAGTGLVYRMLPRKGSVVHPFPIPESEKGTKVCRISSKSTVRGGKTHLGTHDGRTFLVEDGTKYAPGDSLVVDLKTHGITDSVAMKKGSLAIITGGKRLGRMGEIKEVIKGTFSSRASVKVGFPDGEVILPRDLVMPVGVQKPAVTIPVEAE